MRPFVDPNDRYSYEDWMNEMGAEAGLPNLPPMGHPLQKLGARLGELLDEDHWAECERLLLEGWAHDEIDRKTGQHWRENSELQVWFPMTAEELERLRAENERLKNDAAIYYESAAAETAAAGEPVAWMTVNDDGDPLMLFFDHIEAMSYCNEGEVPIELFTADQLASAAQIAPPAVVASQGVVEWPVMPPSKGQSPVLFEDGYAEGWAKCLEACKAALAATKTGE